jgi:hypothetical protein
MDYMLMFYQTSADFEERGDKVKGAAYMAGWMSYVQAVQAAGIVKSGEGLQVPSTATTVRVENGKRRVQDGPFADAKEQLGGFFVIDVADLDTALAWAARAPCASTGGVEVRPTIVRQSA